MQRKFQRRAWGSVRGANREHGLREGGQRTTRNRKRTLFGIYFFPTSIPTLLSPNPTYLLRTSLHAQLQRTPLIASFPSAFFGVLENQQGATQCERLAAAVAVSCHQHTQQSRVLIRCE